MTFAFSIRNSSFLKRAAALVLAVSSASATLPLEARPLEPAERRYLPYSGAIPGCDDPSVLSRIQSRFHDAESEFWLSGLDIVGFERVEEIGYRSNGVDYIPRRYCMGRVYMNDQKLRTISYSIAENLGIIGVGFGVEWCVAGLDREYAYAPNCKMARP
jgi:hypothetical protein